MAIAASAGHPDTYRAPNCCTRWHPSLAGLTKLARKSVRWARPNEVGDERRKFAACASPLDTHWNACIAREKKSLHTHVHPSVHVHEIHALKDKNNYQKISLHKHVHPTVHTHGASVLQNKNNYLLTRKHRFYI